MQTRWFAAALVSRAMATPTPDRTGLLGLKRPGLPRCGDAPKRNSRQRQRDEEIIARKRQAKEAPSRLIAAHHARLVHLVDQAAAGAEIGHRAGAVLWPRPPVPLHARMIDAEA